ncbi:MAG: HAD family phosphatase [Candidatus Liptonbacteria bacterium]
MDALVKKQHCASPITVNTVNYAYQPMIRAIFFDFFGVTCSDIGWIWFAKHLRPKDRPWFSETLHDADVGKISEQELYKIPGEKSGMPAEEVRREFKSEININREVVDIILTLKERYKIGLISNASESMLNTILRESGIADLFEQATISSKLHIRKPDLRIFEEACRIMGVKPEESVFIDDRQENLDGAKDAGFAHTILYTTPEETASGLRRLNILD